MCNNSIKLLNNCYCYTLSLWWSYCKPFNPFLTIIQVNTQTIIQLLESGEKVNLYSEYFSMPISLIALKIWDKNGKYIDPVILTLKCLSCLGSYIYLRLATWQEKSSHGRPKLRCYFHYSTWKKHANEMNTIFSLFLRYFLCTVALVSEDLIVPRVYSCSVETTST